MTNDELVERVAEAIHASEYGRYRPEAHRDHNQWTWPNAREYLKETCRIYARAAIQAMKDQP